MFFWKKAAEKAKEAEQVKNFQISVAILRANPVFDNICDISKTSKQAFILFSEALIQQKEMEGVDIVCSEKWQRVIRVAVDQFFSEKELREKGIFFYNKN